MQFWDKLEGKSLAGTYPLNRWLRTEGNAAWFATRYQDKPAIAYVVEIARDDDPVVPSLEIVSRLQHPNIVRIERVGRATIDGESIGYAIQEPTEDNLSDALKERPLTTAETWQIAESLVCGLGALHTGGLLHGNVKATAVLAVGDTVKLRSDCVRKVADAHKDKPAAYAQDVDDMGSLLFECLTQRRLAGPEDPAIAKLPSPFAGIVKNTVTGTWGLSNVAAALKLPVDKAPAAPPAAKAQPATAAQKWVAVPPNTAPVVASASPKAVPVATRATPLTPLTAVSTTAAAPALPFDEPVKKNSGIRIVALLAILLVLGAVWYFFRGAQKKTAAVPAAVTTSSASAPTAGDTTTVPPIPAPEAAAPAPPPTQMPPAAGQQRALDASPSVATSTAAAAPGQKVWRVVVFTYGDQAKAQHRVDLIARRHPDLKPEVFTPAGHGPYLVTIGGPMDHDEAAKARSHARKEGMARDAYLQNYTH